ncbi:GDSL-type esterase/lipase family protein [Kiloniella laminariae]|uniref:GDSL-type esterase/lipase family protein n=1 Tax=Kiloniella laminariae TaxID=454162 RepID=A0ABT4LNP8_9PROT|nr:GDSL-type esterase/lipase family protein [Kiloniella laminariae]MCZ4282744.1 GDSL-type esterase/lipase family protein [Kiloniella laminariae]
MKRICFVGASVMEGMGDSEKLGLPGRLALLESKRGRDFIHYNLGVRGQTIREIAKRAVEECLARLGNSTDIGIVFASGSNDFATLDGNLPRTPPHRAFKQFRELALRLREVAPVLALGPTPVEETKMPVLSPLTNMMFYFNNQTLATGSEGYQHVCVEEKIPYIDLFSLLQNSPEYLAGLNENDGLHSNAKGYQAMAKVLSVSSEWNEFWGT